MRDEFRERKLDDLPLAIGREMCPVGLPRPDRVLGAQVQRILLAIPTDEQTDSCMARCIERAPFRVEVQRRLDEPAIILQAYVTSKAQARSLADYVVNDRGLGDTTHYLVTHRTPSGAQCRDKVFVREVVDQHVGSLRHIVNGRRGQNREDDGGRHCEILEPGQRNLSSIRSAPIL